MKPNKNKKVVSTSIPVREYDALVELCDKTKRSQAFYIREAIHSYLESEGVI